MSDSFRKYQERLNEIKKWRGIKERKKFKKWQKQKKGKTEEN